MAAFKLQAASPPYPDLSEANAHTRKEGTKEEKDLSLFKEVREREAKLVDQRYRNKVIQNVKSEGFNKSLDDWSRKGFTN